MDRAYADPFVARLVIWELAQLSYFAAAAAADAAGDIGPPQYVDDAHDVAISEADRALTIMPTTITGILELCRWLQDDFFVEDEDRLGTGIATISAALPAIFARIGAKLPLELRTQLHIAGA